MTGLRLRIRILMLTVALVAVVSAIAKLNSGALLNPNHPINQMLGLGPVPQTSQPASR